MTTRVLLAVDLSYQTYRAAAAHPMLTSRRTFTGGLYGFLTTFAKMVRETRATDVAFCQDVKPYRRSETYPEYKQIRKKNADEELLKMYKQSMSLVLETLKGAGLTVWGIPGFESDDLIGHCVAKYRHRFHAIYAASNDSDLYQLFTASNFYVYRKSIADLMHRKVLMDKHGLTPAQFMMATALMGTHNDIEGIRGVGIQTAVKAVLDPALLRSYREKHAPLIDRNLALIKLPHPDFPHDAAIPTRHADFKPRELYRQLGYYDIDVTPSIERAFQQLQGDGR